MKRSLALFAAVMPCLAQAANLITAGDPVIAIDTGGGDSGLSGYPGAEAPAMAIDGNNASKYLNTGGPQSGFIATPFDVWAVKSFQIVTGNDADGRDPASYALYGTNGAISSTDNSRGIAESWTLIQAGSLSLPTARNTASGAINIINTTEYEHYKMIFPTLRGNDSLMQFSEVQFYSEADILGSAVFTAGNTILAIDASESRFPAAENPGAMFDNNVATKYLNFGENQSGFIVDPSFGLSVLDSFEIWTANDDTRRDPSSYAIYGSTGSIKSLQNSTGEEESWTLIASGSLALPDTRQVSGGVVSISNTSAYDLYKVVFPTIKDSGTNSMQISGFQLYGTAPVPEPGSVTALLASSLLAFRRRRS